MEDTSQPAQGSDPEGDRLSRLSAASLRINESLEFDVVLQGALDSARSLTGARYGVMTLLGDGGMVEDFLASGLSDEESELLWLMPEGLSVFQALTDISEPMRVPDLTERDGVELMGDIMAVSHIPVIFLSAYGRDEMVARALEEGADDYIVKPFSPTELVARVRAVLRRSEEPERPARSEPFTVGDLRIDYAGRRVTVSDNPVELTATEFDLLAELVAEAGRVVSHDRLLRRVWSPGKPGNLRVLRTHMRRLRRKLGEDAASPRYIVTEPRVGYRMPKGDGVVSS